MRKAQTQPKAKRQIIAIGGAALTPELDNLLLVEYFLKQTRKKKPRVCFIGAAHGDADAGRLRFYAGLSQFNCKPTHLPLFARTPRDLASFVLEQDAIIVGGGNTRSMLAVWRDWGLDVHLRAAWLRGVVLGGWSAGSICWFEQGITDSIAGPLTAMNCLGFLPGSNCPHYDSERQRRPTYRRMIAGGKVAGGYAADDGVALHFIGEQLAHVVANRSRARGWQLARAGKRAVERALPTRNLAKR
ncbi:MAG: peptidase E [Betaproteobacteria bacterium]|nr:peptidase E [Betaproteobacteria bacterium]MDH4294269.1 peptidase E [Betaproteobacteria bacterium]